ncbi:MAG: cysteine desulfurase [Anaerolineales bacterium]
MHSQVKLFDVERIREQFPVLSREVYPGTRLVYLDSAATSQKPRSVIESLVDFYEHHNSNIHRGIHKLAEEATQAHEGARKRIADFIGARTAREVVFTRNATESINLLANAWGRANLKAGDLVLLTEMEHHSNLVPWYLLAEEIGLRLEFVPVTDQGKLDLDAYRTLLEEEPRLVAFVHVSNMLGTINPVAQMTGMAHEAGALVLVDGAQSVPHLAVDVSELDVDFYAFSGHKMCGPTGIGVFYGREALLEAMPPFMGGGDMIKRVSFDGFTPNDIPWKFEAGTPAIAQAIGLGAAVDFLNDVGIEDIHTHERVLTGYALDRLSEVPGVTIYGPELDARGGVVSYTMAGIHPHDVAQILDHDGIAVRAGHHCTMPLHERFKIPASVRASFYLYNTMEEIDRLIEGLHKVIKVFDI